MNRIAIILIGAALIAAIAGSDLINTSNKPKGPDPAALPRVEGDIDIKPDNKEATEAQSKENAVDFLKAASGWNVTYFAKELGKPRVIAFDPNGVMLVSVPAEGKVVAVLDKDKNGVAEETKTILRNLNEPHGLAFRKINDDQFQLYVAETNKVSVYDYQPMSQLVINGRKILDLPSGSGHSSRTIMYLPEQNKILVSVGSACNVCVEKDKRRAAILIANADGTDSKIYADGLRNSVFLRVQPRTGEILATDMGRDHLGDNLPPDEVNIIKEGGFYGWPYAYGQKVQDKSFEDSSKAREMTEKSTSSFIDIPAHSAPLGLDFIRDGLLVAYHGSWNRSTPTGYKVVRYPLDASGRARQAEEFLTGFIQGSEVKGRPVDVVVHDGAVYISDDKAGNIYRVTPDNN